MCDAYRSNPGWYTGSPSALGRDVGRLASLAMDSLCDDRPLPPPMTVPFQGGQCSGIEYDVTFKRTNPSTGVNSNFTRRLFGKLGGMSQRRIGTSISGLPIVRYGFQSSITTTSPAGLDNDLSSGTPDQFKVDLVSIVRVGGGLDNCGNPPPSDSPAPIGDSTSVNINLPDLRVSPSATVVVPVVIFKPEFNFRPDLSVDFNIKFDMGGQKFIFNGSEFRTGGDVDIDFSPVTNSITNAQTNINNNTNTNTTNINTSIANNHSSTRSSINSNTSTSITNAQTNINTSTQNSITNNNSTIANNTNTSLVATQNNINNNTNSSITNLSRDINASLNIVKVDLSAQLQFIANLTGIINADLKIALEFLRTINDKPECPELPLPVDELPEPPVEKPPDDGGDSTPKKRLAYVEVALTKFPDKSQFGNRTAQNVYFAGWFAFRSGNGAFHTREQINFQRSLFIAPQGSDGYTYTLTHGAKGIVKEYYV